MNTIFWTIVGVVVVLVLWHVWGYSSSRVEQMRYTVLEKRDGYEIRNYAPHIVAQTTVQGEYRDALNQGFRIVAGYIFGGNVQKQSIAMTAPVTEKKGTKIAMTAPVTAAIEGDSHTIAFGMPASYTLATLPQPNDSRVQLVEVPEQKMAVLTLSWYVSAARIDDAKARLLAMLANDKMTVTGEATYAGYNAPWTPPWLLRNEVMIPIR